MLPKRIKDHLCNANLPFVALLDCSRKRSQAKNLHLSRTSKTNYFAGVAMMNDKTNCSFFGATTSQVLKQETSCSRQRFAVVSSPFSCPRPGSPFCAAPFSALVLVVRAVARSSSSSSRQNCALLANYNFSVRAGGALNGLLDGVWSDSGSSSSSDLRRRREFD